MQIHETNFHSDKVSLQQLSDCIDDLRFNFEKSITALDTNPENLEHLNVVTEIVQEIKSRSLNEDIVIAAEFCSVIHSICNTLIDKKYQFIHLLSEVLLLSYDHLYDLINHLLQPNANFNDEQTKRIIAALIKIQDSNANHIQQDTENALQVLTSQFLILESNDRVSDLTEHVNEYSLPQKNTQIEIDRTFKLEKDMVFFRAFLNETSHRFPNIKSRCERIIPLALQMNHLGGEPVNNTQLEAAILLHDVGMSFIPESVLEKKANFTIADRALLHSHPVIIADMLVRMELWNEAAEIIRQHHEKLDGTGYPNKLVSDQICIGAKIIAILDAFDAMTNTRSDRPFKKTILRAVREIVTNTTQFDAYWAQIFVQVVKTHNQNKKS